MIVLQLAILLICIFIGARMSGIGLGVMGMIGLLIFHVWVWLATSRPSH
jgi:anaerobic C4-dicarboxylate transporter DcuA